MAMHNTKKKLLKLRKKVKKLLEELPSIMILSNIDNLNVVRWRRAIERHTLQLDKYLPGNDFEKYRANIPWHAPNKRTTKDDYNRGCNITKGFLEDALDAIQEELDKVVVVHFIPRNKNKTLCRKEKLDNLVYASNYLDAYQVTCSECQKVLIDSTNSMLKNYRKAVEAEKK